GSQQIFGAWDHLHGEEVAARGDTGEQLRWLGRWQPRVSTTYYADADCTQPAALAECVPDFAQPTTARETDGNCGGLTGHRELLQEVQQIYSDNGNGCVAQGWTSPALRMWQAGEPLVDADFASAGAVDGGADRMRYDIFTTPEGEPFLPSDEVHDRLLDDVACYWQDTTTYSTAPSTSASFNCIPQERAVISGGFQDADCTQGVAWRLVYFEECPSTAQYAYDHDLGVVAAITGPAPDGGSFALDDQETCVPLGPVEPSEDTGGEYEYSLIEDERTEVAHAVDLVD
ncbi:MAG: hypothetical protein KC457_31170, partial [Myxococcales bacterium]|nr:hypothetical protein [Myxococcales bacterium]